MVRALPIVKISTESTTPSPRDLATETSEQYQDIVFYTLKS